MFPQLESIRNDFARKSELLNRAQEVLKKEYLGIDNVIEEIINNVRSWYTLASMQDKPTVINLWGLTGVGKTSLILKLMDLLDFSDRTYKLDLGEKDGNLSFRSSLADLCENPDNEPIVIMLDEFQHARTLEGPFRKEITDDKNRTVWELIDSGKINYFDYTRGTWRFDDLVAKLKSLLKSGIKVKNGLVTDRLDLYLNEMEFKNKKNEIVPFFPKDEYDLLLELVKGEMNLHLKKDIEKELMKMDGDQTIHFLKKVSRITQRPTNKSFAKALIVILGNIDEAYTMGSNFTTDIPANEFYEQSLKISVPDIKMALRHRFRDEQIARLGNIHIIYPALNTKAYYGIIHLELGRIISKIKTQFDIELKFEQSVIEVLYREGVYPSQGARPIFTTIHQLIKSRISNYINIILENNLNTKKLIVFIKDDSQITCEFYEKKELKFIHSDKLNLTLTPLRNPKKDEIQAITAVHESGHAILSSFLLGNVPELVLTVSADSNNEGFVYNKINKNYLNKNEILPTLAVFLGGIAAEELIFGKGNITTGASKDLEMATQFIIRLLKQNGMGRELIHYASSMTDDTHFYHEAEKVEDEALKLMQQAKVLAMDALQKEKRLLLMMSTHLSEFPKLTKSEIKIFIRDYANSQIERCPDERFYRDKLAAEFRENTLDYNLNYSDTVN